MGTTRRRSVAPNEMSSLHSILFFICGAKNYLLRAPQVNLLCPYIVKERTRLLGVDQVIKCLLSLVLLGRRELLLFEIVKHLHEQLCVCLLRPRLLHTGQSARHAQHTQVPKQAYKTAWLGKVEPPTCSPTTSSIDCGSIAFAAAAASQNAASARAWYSMLRWQ